MSRSNPYKLKPRAPLLTVLAMGEGDTEGAFLSHLKAVYGCREDGIRIKVDWTNGGSPADMIDETIRKKRSADYSRGFLLLDTDFDWPGDQVKTAKAENLTLIGSIPCVEGLLLSILDDKKDWTCRNTVECKKQFHSLYLDEKQKLLPENYERLFSKAALESARKRVKILDEILVLLTSKKA